jgi:nicastrin
LATAENLSDMESNEVRGVLILGMNRTASTLAFHSPDSKTPNHFASLYKDEDVEYEWNPTGTSLSQMNFNFPISVVKEESQTYLEILEALDFNSNKNYEPPSYAMQWNSLMKGAVNSNTCLRRERCNPIGGHSIFASFSNYSAGTTEDPDKPIIFLNSWLGGEGFLKGVKGGAQSQYTGVVALMAIADALKSVSCHV